MASLSQDDHYDPSLFVPEFAEVVRSKTDAPVSYSAPWLVGVEFDEEFQKPISGYRDRILLNFGDGGEMRNWQAPALSDLFRGEEKAPSLDRFPNEYLPFFIAVELNVVEFANLTGMIPTDSEMREIYNSQRRHPDGRSRGALHDHVWKGCALALATRPWSRHQYEAVLGRMEKSCRTFTMGPVSRNYLHQIEKLRY